MATQNEPSLPLSNSDERKSADLLPRFYRTDSNKKFFSATLDQLLQPGKAKKLTGFIGRKNAKAVKASDVFVKASDNNRQNYQLEPVAVIQDYLGNTNFYKDYIDHVSHIDVNGGNVLNHERLNKQEFYSWNPHINWDKFVNFQQYYWMPYGPGVIEVTGQQRDIESTYTVTVEDEGDNYVYLFSPDGLTRNPTLTLYRGQTYNFDITSPTNPFTIKTRRVSGGLEKYTSGVSASSVERGVLTFNIPLDAPDVLFYVSEADANTGGVLQIKDIDENAFLDVFADILGKKTYTLSSGVPLTNGMQLRFNGIIVPEKYNTGHWFVEGVGTAIKLVAESDLEIISSYSQEKALLFDDEPFDKAPFSTLTSFPKSKDYVVINRASPDRSQWARYNRWFHQDVVIATATANGIVPDLDQTQRATRPIIEFEAGLKLFNFGHAAKQNVDVVDTFTTDVFSTIEGRAGYNVDGVDLSDGMRVLFTADTDRYVNGKIFKVNFITVTNPGRRIDFNAEFEVNIDTDVITFSTEHGLITGSQLTYLNNGNLNISGLVNRKIYYVSVLSNTQIRLYTDKTLSTQADIFAVGANNHTFETFTGLSRQINLVEDLDSTPIENETVLVKLGLENQGSMYWYNGTTWKLGQQKTIVNQAPLFDIFDETGTSYGNNTTYDGSNFTGTKVFSYKVGTGTTDAALGFPLSYQNINNIGDIVFEFNLLKDSFSYKNISTVLTKNTNIGFLKVVNSLETYIYQNGWTKSEITNSQPVVRIFKESGLVNNFPIDVYDYKDKLDDLIVKVYINGRRQNKETFSIVDGVVRKSIVLTTDVTADDVVTLKCYSAQHKNDNGYYEIPLNLQNNPLNQDVTQFTLGEVIDHVDSIVENINGFVGTYPGYGNLRDIGSLTAYGTRFVQHSGPMNLSLYHLGSRTANVIKGLNQARIDYGKFKRAFITFATESGIDIDSRRHVDYILEELSKDKTKTQPYYLSDMFAHAGGKRSEYVVLDSRVTTYPLTTAFNLTSLSNRAVNIYLNGVQLVYGKDYTFGNDVFFEILTELTDGDIIEAFEFDSTDGSFCPATPTKLGLFPAYEPAIFVDTTYLEPTRVIQGHDGSITIAFNDYRDDLILELETRIYNNIKIRYDATIFDIYDFIPGYSRSTAYSKEEFDLILSQYFFEWTSNISQDYTKQDNELWDRLNPFTWNFRNNATPDNTSTPAFWRGIYRWTLDTDRPHTHPWECLGFSVKPTWWDTVYGPSPYTSNNFILWDDIKNGVVREPGVPIRTYPKFAKTILATGAPVDEDGNILDPYNAGQVQGYINPTSAGYYEFGDVGPVESAWRRSSYYAFGVIQTALLMQPNHVLATCLDRSRTVRNLTNQLVYADTDLRVKLTDIKIPSTSLSTARVNTAGLINYIVDYITSDTTLLVSEYASDLLLLTNKIGSKLGGFTSKPKFKLLLDSKNVSSSGGIFIPEENYHIISNVSSPIKKIVYSGVAITKYVDGYEVRGYNTDHPYFTYYPYTLTGRVVNVGGISESYSTWSSDKYYTVGKLIKANNQYYRCTIAHRSGSNFEPSNFARIAELPVTGGRTAELRKAWDLNNPQNISYGTKFTTVQDVVDFLQGYGAYLTAQGFVFDEFNNSLKTINNWETSVQEFLFWTTQNWSDGAILALSPAANTLILTSDSAVVNNIQDSFFEYKVFRVDGQKLDSNFTNTFREGNTFTLSPSNTNHGIYGASLYLVQKEHVILLDNTTLFNDVIYDQAPGYRQERIKVIGYISTNWNGGYNIPGFIYDQARIQDWTSWTDYNLGDIVKYKEFYYSASAFLPGTETFNSDSWIRLDEKPEAQLLPNWEYKTMQFTDFYSLDTDNFDTGQQKMAQHLIGYQKRQYLENIIQDDVSQYKFYQGMIIEKGSLNVFNKLFDVLSADDQESLTFNEEWAIRVGNYGATTTFNELEFKLDESRFKLNPQPFELVSSINTNVVDFVYRQLPTDVYIKPVGYNNNPWSAEGTSSYLRTPGYVRYEDVRLNIDTLADIVDSDISNFIEGDYVWCAFENKTVTVNNTTEVWNWDIYRFTETPFNITNASYTNATLTLDCDRIPNLVAGDIIGISNTTTIDGFYTITSVLNQKITINTTITGWTNPFTDSERVVAYYFISARVSNIDDMNSSMTKNIKRGELMWIDNNGQGLYSVYEHNKVFSQATLTNLNPTNNQHFGKTVAISPDGQTAVIVAEDNNVLVYSKGASSNIWVLSAEILYDTTQPDSGLLFGTSVEFSPDGKWIAISAPGASDVDSSGLNEQGYVGIYYRATSNSFELYETVTSQNPDDNEKFGSNIVFGIESPIVTTSTSIVDAGIQIATVTVTTYYMAVTAVDAVYTYKNVITRTTTTVNNISDLVLESATDWLPFSTVLTEGTGDEFGHSISMSTNGKILAVSAPAANLEAGAVYVYQLTGNEYNLVATLDDDNASDRFGESISISPNGTLLSVGCPYINTNAGKVFVYKSPTFNLHQTLFSNEHEAGEIFGLTLKSTDTSLIVFSLNGDVEREVTFNEGGVVTLDNNSTRIVDIQVDAGRVDIYDLYNTKYVYGESLDTSLNNDITDLYGHSIAVSNNNILVGAPSSSVSAVKDGKVYAYQRLVGTKSWSVKNQENLRPNAYKIKKAFIYDRTTNELAAYIDVVDPIQGKIPGPADQEISYKTFFDPATYSVGTNTVNVDDGMNWSKAQVGMLWWDLTRAKFLDNQAGGVVYRSTTWNTLYETASIDIYEWVETKYLPSDWDKLSGTDKGNSLGISGTTKYGDAVYSIKKRYDSTSQSFQNTYYYWVLNPTVAPNIIGRSLSAYNVSRLISDPVSEGYSCIALTGTNSFSLVNVTNLIDSTNFNLTVQYWIVDMNYTTSNAHNQWKILSEHPNTVIPLEIEQKWIHSLIGKDNNNRVVPDIKLPFKQRYGVGFRPRQSMFVNRVEALKQYIERVNSVLATKLIADDYDLTDLEKFNAPPSAPTGDWDISIDTDLELRFVGVATLQVAELTPIIVDGRLVGANIVQPGAGYVYAPYVTIKGTGRHGSVRTVINTTGQVTGVEIVSAGEGYLDNTMFTVRPFTVLVLSDTSTFDKWSTYQWNATDLLWERNKGQSYDVTRYWSYIDWYATGYNQFTKIDNVVENTYELAILDSNIGDIVKVNNIGSGGWLLLEKYNDAITIDYTQNYKVVGRDNGTIMFSKSLYDYSGIGYDSSLFDSFIYDNLAETELKIIIETIRNKILVDEFRVEYLKLFFASVRYAMYEQTFVDWAFKTSFVKATHNVGSLKQKVNYNSDNLSNFEDYIKEVKPYRTQIREYVSSYTGLDKSQTSVTDFDLLPTINSKFEVAPITVKINDLGEIETPSSEITTYPWKHWYDNVGFTVQSIELVDGGSGYISNPVVIIEGGFGSGASAKAYVTNGRVNRIQLVTNGSGYLKAPTITISGGLAVGGTAARASVIIESEVVRANKISVKFDRITRNYFVTELTETESGDTDPAFVGTGSRLQFVLKYSPQNKVDPDCYVRVGGVDLLRDEYTLVTKTSTAKGFTSYSGLLTLTTAPAVGVIVEITYKKNFAHLSAADRINFYYNPASGMYGKDLSQLMTGIDYGGTSVTGLGFNISGGWDALPWFTDSWDGFDAAFDDFIIVVSTSTIKAGNFVPGRYYTIADLGYTTIEAGELIVGQEYKITSLGTTSQIIWNIIAGTTGVTYTVGSTFIANNIGTSMGAGTVLAQSDITSKQSDWNTIAGTPLLLTITTIAANVCTTSAEHGLHVGDTFTPRTTEKGFTAGTTYYIKTVDSTTTFTVSTSSAGPTKILTAGPSLEIFADTTNITYVVGDKILVVNNIGGTGTATPLFNAFKLPYVPTVGEKINVYLNGIRIDDLDYVGSPLPGKPAVVMSTITGDGITDIVELPGSLTIANGDKIIFRKSTSDGSFEPLPNEYDTQITGGDLAYASASGLSPDDIILDGDGLVTPTTSAAPEEIVPGHITDAVAIKVFQLPTSAAAKIAFNSQRADGVSNEFSLGQIPANFASIFVKVNNIILKENTTTVVNDYTVNWQEQKVVLTNTPTVGQLVDIITFGVASNDLLDTNYFVSDGTTTEFVTNAPWLLSGLGSVILVNGEAIPYVLFNTNESYDSPNKVGIRFGESPVAGALITYMITSDQNQSASIIKTENIVGNNTTQTFTLSNALGEAQPFANNILVIKNGQVLRPSNTEYFTLADDVLVYTLSASKTQPYFVNLTDYSVYLDGVKLSYGDEYLFDIAGVSVTVKKSKYKEGAQLSIVSVANVGYTVNGNEITFNTAPLSTDVVRVTSFYNHNIEEIQRTAEFTSLAGTLTYESYEYFRYENLTSGRFKLNKTVMMDDYVWIIKNNQLLTHSVDYYLDSDLITIKLKDTLISSDVLDVICFNDRVVNSSYGYMQFKDMLNRTHYKRISKTKSTRLARDLRQKDVSIYVMNGEALGLPNPAMNLPGIIEINGERIEYFTKVGNVLGQLRRGTLGTGAPELHRYSTLVLDIGPSETIPYTDRDVVNEVIGSNINSTFTADGIIRVFNLPSIAKFGDGSKLNLVVRINNKETTDYTLTPGITGGTISFNTEILLLAGNTISLVADDIISVRSLLVELPYTPVKGQPDPAKPNYDPKGVIQWFVKYGYSFKDSFVSGVRYTLNDVVEYNNVYYKNILPTSTAVPGDTTSWTILVTDIPVGFGQSRELSAFVGGYRLKNQPFSLFEESKGYPYSPEGDSIYPAEFSVKGVIEDPTKNRYIRLTSEIADTVKVVIAKRPGRLWTPLTADLTYTNNEIANFIKNTETVFSQYLVDKYQYVLAADTGVTLLTDDNEPLELD